MRQLEPQPMAPEHREYWQDQYSAYSEEQFIEAVCNSPTVLPEAGLPEPVIHLPCCWLGDTGSKSYLREVLDAEARKRLGWRDTQYLLVLPAPNDQDIATSKALNPNNPAGALLRRELEHAGVDLKATCATYVTRFSLPSTVRQYTQRQKKAGIPWVQADIRGTNPDVIIACGADSLKALYGRKAKLDTVRGDILYYELDGRRIPVIPTVSHLAFLGGYANISVFRSELRRAHEIANRLFSQRRIAKHYRICETAEQVEALCQDIESARPPFIAFDTEFGNDVAREEFTYTLSVQLAWGPGKAAFIKLRDQVELPRPEFNPPDLKDWLFNPELSGYKRPKQVWDSLAAALELDPEAEPAALRKYRKWCHKVREDAFGREGRDYHVRVGDARWWCGQKIHTEEQEHRIWAALQKLMLDRRWKIAAHHLRVDVDQFARNGYPIDERVEDGIDTMLIHHLLYGDEDQGLDHLVRKYVPEFGAYWRDLEEWLTENSRKRRLRFGYRDIPLDILVPYALADADATWRLVLPVLAELKEVPELRKLYWTHVAPTSLHLLDVERQGILIDEEQRMRIREAYEPVYEQLLERVRQEINWPAFKPTSSPQMASLLFSDHVYRDKKYYKWSDGRERELPEGVKGLHLTPLFNTEKYPKFWKAIQEAGEEELNAPSSKAAVLELLSHEHPELPVLRWLKHLSVIGKFLSSYLAPQQVNEFGVVEDGDGFHNNIWRDGRVRTHLNQLTSTGRYSSYKANLQTKPKRQEAAAFEALVEFYFGCSVSQYKARCAEDYDGPDRIELKDQIAVPKFASCFIAPPGYVLLEADFATAEMCIWAYVSGDPDLTKVVQAGRDMHSEVCAQAFSLPELADLATVVSQLEAGDREPYDQWAEGIKKKYGALRIAAKTVNFGIMYGRGANALAIEINKVVDDPVTAEDTQKIIDGVAKKFPVAWQWLVDNSEKAVTDEWVANAFGRRRYFQGVSQSSAKDKAAAQREAKNSPIQGCISTDEYVYTFGGVRRLGDMASLPGERVSHGTVPRRAVYAAKGRKDTLTLVLGNGASLCCTPDHLVEVLTPDGREWLRADELRDGALVAWESPVLEDRDPVVRYEVAYEGSNARHSAVVETEVTQNFGYLLGFTVGDGSISGKRNDVRYTAAAADAECLEPIAVELERLGAHLQRSSAGTKVLLGVTSAAIKGLLLDGCGIDQRLHAATGLPAVAFNCTRQTQLAVLDGYLTADGSVNAKDGSITWVTKSERLCRDVANLVAGLGYRSSWFCDGAGYYRGSIPKSVARRLCDEYPMFQHHRRKREYVVRRVLNGSSRGSAAKLSVPNWYARRCLPDTPPKQRAHASAYVLYNRVQRGHKLSLAAVNQYEGLGWESPDPVIPLAGCYNSGVREVADLSVVTTDDEQRWFYANGFKVHNCVADLLAKAGYLLYRFLNRTEVGRQLDIKILLPIHDAFLFQVKIEHIREAVKVADMCLSALNKIPGTDYSLGVDQELMARSWGDKAVDPHKPEKLQAFIEEVTEAA